MGVWAFAVMLASAQGFRTPKGDDEKMMMVSSSKPPAGNIANTKGNIDWTLNELGKVDPVTVAVDMINGIADLDFDKPLGPQMADLAVSLGGTIADMIHPLLGVVFSIFAGLFGWGGADSDGTFVQDIMENVDKLITHRLNQEKVDAVEDAISGVMSAIDMAGDSSARWDTIPISFSDKFTLVFQRCWGGKTEEECAQWRKGGSAGQALVLELQFTELAIMSTATVAEHGHRFASFAGHVEKAARLTQEHYGDAAKAASFVAVGQGRGDAATPSAPADPPGTTSRVQTFVPLAPGVVHTPAATRE